MLFSPIRYLYQFIHDPLRFTTDMRKKHGDLFSIYLGPKKFFFAYHPDHAEAILGAKSTYFRKSRLIFDKIKPITGERGLVQLEGEAWEKLRKLTGEIFQRQAMTGYPNIINHYVDKLVIDIDERVEQDQRATVDIAALMMAYTIKTAARIIFAGNDDQAMALIANQFVELNHLCGLKMRSVLTLPLFVPTPNNRKIKCNQRLLQQAIRNLINNSQTIQSASVLSLIHLLLAKHPEDMPLIYDQLMTFLFAGYETTAASLTFCLYLLAKHKAAQQKIRDEIGDLTHPQLADAKKFTYTLAVYREALRLFPPAWILAREALSTCTLDGHTIGVRDNLILCVREIHRHEDFWERPHAFLPERFLSGHDHHKFAFIPFGMGKRICSGNQLALLESIIAIARLCQQYEFSMADQSRLEIEAMVTLHPKHKLLLEVARI